MVDLLGRCIIHPNDPTKMKWDVLIGALIVASVLVIPVRVGFDLPRTGTWDALDYCIDCLFLLDIFASFRTATLDENGAYNTVPATICREYLRGWFLVDFLTTVPVDKIYEAFKGGGQSLRSLKLVRAMRLFRLFKMVRVLRMGDAEAIDDLAEQVGPVPFRVGKLMLTLLFIGHLFGCFWSFTSIQTAAPEEFETRTWWGADGLREEELFARYIASLYWAFTTITTVGYGDILAVTDEERAFSVVIMITGATVFGYTVGSLSSLATRGRAARLLHDETMMEVNNYLEEQDAPRDVRAIVRKQVEGSLKARTAMDEESILLELPYALRSEVLASAYAPIIPRVSLFDGQGPSFVCEMVRIMRFVTIKAQHFFWMPGEEGHGTYFLIDGAVEVIGRDEDGGASVRGVVDQGGAFGLDWVMQAAGTEHPDAGCGYRAFTTCFALSLPDHLIQELASSRPAIFKTIVARLRELALADVEEQAEAPPVAAPAREEEEKKSAESSPRGGAAR